MKKFLFLLLLIGAISYGMLSHHFIVLDDRVKILKKITLGPHNTIIDARGAKKWRMLLEPDLVEAGIVDVIQ